MIPDTFPQPTRREASAPRDLPHCPAVPSTIGEGEMLSAPLIKAVDAASGADAKLADHPRATDAASEVRALPAMAVRESLSRSKGRLPQQPSVDIRFSFAGSLPAHEIPDLKPLKQPHRQSIHGFETSNSLPLPSSMHAKQTVIDGSALRCSEEPGLRQKLRSVSVANHDVFSDKTPPLRELGQPRDQPRPEQTDNPVPAERLNSSKARGSSLDRTSSKQLPHVPDCLRVRSPYSRRGASRLVSFQETPQQAPVASLEPLNDSRNSLPSVASRLGPRPAVTAISAGQLAIGEGVAAAAEQLPRSSSGAHMRFSFLNKGGDVAKATSRHHSRELCSVGQSVATACDTDKS